MLTKDLRTIPYHWTGAVLTNPQGEPIGITGIGRDVSDRKQAEDELKQQRRHLVEAQALAHLGSWEWDIGSGEARWSDELYRIFGHEPGSITLTYDTFLAVLLPDDHDRVLAAINDALAGKTPYDIEYRIVRPNGDVRVVHAQGDVHRDATGHPLSMAGTALDITERKRIEDALRAGEERWHLAVRGSNDGIWDWNIQTGEVFFSPRWKAMRGFEEDEITNHVDEWRSRIHPDDLDRVLQSIDAYLAKQRPEFCEEYRVQRKDGSYIWILDRGVALWADDGTSLRMVGSESDVTEHRQALLRLAEQESLLRSILDAEPECVMRVTADGTLLHMNEAGLCFIEADSFEQVAGRSVYGFVAPEFLERYRSMHEAVIRGASQQLEFQIVGLKGTRRWMETHAVPLQNPIDHRVEYLAITRDICERKRGEEALRESEQRFVLAVEGSNDILWDAHRLPGEPWYAPQTPIWWSPRVQELLGLEESESFETLDQWASRLHPDDKDRVFGQLAAHIDCRVPYDAEYRLRTNRGDYRWIRGRGQAMWDEQGEPRRMSGSCQDITEHKQVEEALRASEARFRALAEETTDWMWEINEQGSYTYCSPKIRDLLGYEPEEALGKTPFVFMPEEEARRVADLFGPIAAARKPFAGVENMNRHKDGRLVVLECRGVPIIDANGVFRGYRGFDQDITDRKRAEEAIREAELRYRTIFKQAGAGVAQIESRTGQFVQVNRQYCEIVGLTEAEMLATTVEALTHPDDVGRNFESRTRLLSGEIRSFTMEKRYVRKDGSIVWVNLNVAPLWRPGEMPVHHIAIVQDITERKRAEEALRLSERQLRIVLDALPVGVWFTDQSGKPVLANPAAKQIWSGIKQVGIETATNAMGWWEAIGPSSELHRWALSHALTKGVSSLNETLDLECLDGTKKTIRNTTVPVQDEAGVVLGAIVLNEDITALRQAQEALKLTQFSVDHAVEGFFWIGPDSRILNVNEAACRMLEYTRDELTTMTVHDIDPNFSLKRWSAYWEELKQKGSMTFESKYWSRTGHVLDTEVTVNYLQYEGREYNCAIMRDIGERKRMEEALRQRERDLRAAVEERERISQDLHDGILQSLFAMGLTLESTKSMMSPRNRKTSGPPLDQAIDQLNRVMHEIRNFIAGLGSDLLQGKDLPTALQHMLKSLTQNQATRVRLAVEDRAAQAVSAEQSLHLLLVIQEAVSNCIRHGRAPEARVSLKMLKQGVRLSIRDNGRGFNPKAAKGIGHGLSNMAARTQRIASSAGACHATLRSRGSGSVRHVSGVPERAMVEGDARVMFGKDRNLLPPAQVIAAAAVSEHQRGTFAVNLVVLVEAPQPRRRQILILSRALDGGARQRQTARGRSRRLQEPAPIHASPRLDLLSMRSLSLAHNLPPFCRF